MSGRGRGRGRGRPPPSASRLLLQRSAQEAGLDAGNLRNLQDITKPRLFPDFEWHSSGCQGHDDTTPTSSHGGPQPPHPGNAMNQGGGSSSSHQKKVAANVYLINKSREIHHRFQNSPFFVRPSQEVDVVRYGKRPRPLEPDANISEHMGRSADPSYLPEELLPDKVPLHVLNGDSTLLPEEGGPKRAKTLEEIVGEGMKERKQKALQRQKDAQDPASGEPAAATGGDLSDAPIEDEEDEEVADYAKDYYASEDESDGGGGGDEATF